MNRIQRIASAALLSCMALSSSAQTKPTELKVGITTF